MVSTEQERVVVLKRFGASTAIAEEILAYDALLFNHNSLNTITRFPLPDEKFVAEWKQYALELKSADGFEFLADRLVQLNFPISKGISQTSEYIAVTRKGCIASRMPSATGLNLVGSCDIRVLIHPTWAGRVPVIIVPAREDFVSLLRAFTAHNEPVLVPKSMGACIVSGYNNWHRFRMLSQTLSSGHEPHNRALRREKESYQDRFVLLSCGYYSGVLPERIGLPDDTWRDLSLTIRREHECAHYWTRRVLGSMQNHIVDEIIADYCGILEAIGHFRADWLLMFLGLDLFPRLREARIHTYRGVPPLSDEAFALVQKLVISAVANLECFHLTHKDMLEADRKYGQLLLLLTLSQFTLEGLACESALQRISRKIQEEVSKCHISVEQIEVAG